ncbi:MAG: hypothetical protein LBU68_00730, partial [Rickettsiales bacterium]|nr:hypothetical protein [Rickettsiales bacterium]
LSFADLEKEVGELDAWIADNTSKRDELKKKAEDTHIAATATGAAAIATGIGAGIMAGQNADLKKQESEARRTGNSGYGAPKSGGAGGGGADAAKSLLGGGGGDLLKAAPGLLEKAPDLLGGSGLKLPF